MDDDQQPPQRYWYPFWSSPPPLPSAEPTVRRQLSRRPTDPPPPPPTPTQARVPVFVVVPQEETVEAPAVDVKPHEKATDKEHEEKEKKDDAKSKEKEMEKKDDHKIKEEEKHHVGGDSKPKESKASITLAGKNKGASMKVGGWTAKEQHGHKLNRDKKQADEGRNKGLPALINSNVQVINNSLLLHSSCSGGDPGVHLKLAAKSKSNDMQQQGGGDKDTKK